MTTLSRRTFLLRFVPGLAAAPLAQWPYSEKPVEADTLLSLTKRVAAGELSDGIGQYNDSVQFGLLLEHGRALIELFKRCPPPMVFWPQRPRRG